jgi:hypothetical protein
MMLPFVNEDPRLVPGYEATGDIDTDAMALWEFGLGRERVLGPEGREDVAQRWARGSHGNTAPSAIASAAPCSTCAFFVPLTGSMRMAFGACTNEWSQSDGRVVAVDHGCGAHSQTDVERQQSQWPQSDPIFDNDVSVELDLVTPEPEPEPEVQVEAEVSDTQQADAGVEAEVSDTQQAEAPTEDAPMEDATAEQVDSKRAVVDATPQAAAEPEAN